MTISVKKIQKTTLNVFAGTVGESKRLEALEIQVAETEESKLSKAKEEAVGKLNEYLNPEKYSFNADALKNAIAEGEKAINEATTLEDVQSALDTAKANLDAIPNDEKALSDAKTEAEAKIDDYVGKLDTTKYADCMDEIVGFINESSNKLHDATTPEEATKVADDTINAIESVKAAKDLKDAKAEAEARIDEFVGTLDTTDYQTNMNELLGVINESSNKLHDATTPEEAAKVADEVIEALKAVKSDSQLLADAKAEAEAKIDEFVGTLNTTDYSEENMQELLNKINESSNKLHDATTPEEAAKVADDTIAALDAIETLTDKAIAEASDELSKFIENSDLKKIVPGSDMDYAGAISDAIAEAYNKVNGAESVEDAKAKLAEAKNDILNALKEQLKFYLDTLYNNGEIYYERVLTKTKYDFYKDSITNAESIEKAIFEYEYIVNDRPTEEDFKNEISNTFTNWYENDEYLKHKIPGSDLDYLAVEPAHSAIPEFYSKLWDCKKVADIEGMVAEYQGKVTSGTIEYAKYILDQLYSEGLGYTWKEMPDDSRMILLKEDYDKALAILEGEGCTYVDAIKTVEEACNARVTVDEYNLISAINQAIEELYENYPEENYTVNHDAWAKAMEAAEKDLKALRAEENKTTTDDVTNKYNEEKEKLSAIDNDATVKEKLNKEIAKRLGQLEQYVKPLTEKEDIYVLCENVKTALEEAKLQVNAIESTKALDALMPTLRQQLFDATKNDLLKIAEDTYYTKVCENEEDKTLKLNDYKELVTFLTGLNTYNNGTCNCTNDVSAMLTKYEEYTNVEEKLVSFSEVRNEYNIDVDSMKDNKYNYKVYVTEVAKKLFGNNETIIESFYQVPEVQKLAETLNNELKDIKSLKELDPFVLKSQKESLEELKKLVKQIADELLKNDNPTGHTLARIKYDELVNIMNKATGEKDSVADAETVYKKYEEVVGAFKIESIFKGANVTVDLEKKAITITGESTISKNITIPTGFSCEIKDDVTFNEGAKITVDNGASLTLNESINAYDLLKQQSNTVIENNGKLTLSVWGDDAKGNGDALIWILGQMSELKDGNAISGNGDINVTVGKSE